MTEEQSPKKKYNYIYWASLGALTVGLFLSARFSEKVPIFVPLLLLAGCLVMHFIYHDHSGHKH